jgi:hypothetical protein
MKKILAVLMMLTMIISSNFAHAEDDFRDKAVLNSKMLKAILSGLKDEQDLVCRIGKHEDGSNLIQYFEEDGMNKFRAGFPCSDGRTTIIRGNLSDGGQTATEEFKLVWAN